MIAPAPGATSTFPDVDSGALRTGAGSLASAASALGDQRRSVATVTGGIGGEWKGAARESWNGAGTAAVSDLSRAADGIRRGVTALQRLADEVDSCRARYDAAMGRLATAKGDAAGALADLALEVPSPGNAGPFYQGAQDQLDAARVAIGAAQADAEAAIIDVFAAGRRCGTALSDAAGLASGFGEFAGGSPAGASGAGGEPAPDMQFLTLLLGSVTGNRTAGREFQLQVLRALGIDENTQTLQGYAGGGYRGTIPDGLEDGEMFEVKGVIYQYRSSQIIRQLDAAAASERGYTLVVGPRTKVSPELQEAIREHPYGGEIVRGQADGSFTDLDGNPVEKDESGGWRYPGDDDEWPPGAGGTGGSLNHPGGYGADTAPAPEGEGGEGGDGVVPIVPMPDLPMPAPAPMPLPIPEPIPVPIIP